MPFFALPISLYIMFVIANAGPLLLSSNIPGFIILALSRKMTVSSGACHPPPPNILLGQLPNVFNILEISLIDNYIYIF
jgi:hypothetical protein